MKQLITLLAIMLSLSTYALNDPDPEKNGSITGTVIDKILQEPLPYVSIVIHDLNGEIITGGITDENGSFMIEGITEGKSNLTIQYIGYKAYKTEIEISKKSRKLDLGRIELEEDIESLDEVVIRAETSTIQQKTDRKVIIVGKDLVTAGPTASELMNNLPTVNVNPQTGEISMRGNSNVQVMVDGKLTNVPIAQLLKQIPSSAIKQVELITNPSAKYNPEGMSGIINIVLHKNIKLGMNGTASVGLTYEEQAKFNGSIDLNYRNGKFNVYGNYANNIAKNQNYGNIFRPNDNSEQFFNLLDDNKSNLFKIGLDFYLNEKNTISFFTTQNFYDGKTTGIIDVFYYDNPEFDLNQDFINDGNNISSSYNFDYKLDFEKEGHNIELEADYNEYDSEDESIFSFTGASEIPNYEDFIDVESERVTVNLDYVNPLTEDSKLELGAEARLYETLNDYHSTGFAYNSNGDLVSTPATKFEYSRDIYSAYVTYGRNYEKWSYQAGVRAETVEVIADTNSVRSFENDYVEFYPSAFVTYTPSEKNNYQVSYSRRVDRPGISQVNPIREWSTPLISSFGNTELVPQFTNSIEVNYTRKLEKGSITGGVFYRAITDEINRAVFIDRTDYNKVILTFDNFDNTSAYGFEISASYKPTKWWSFNTSFDLYSQTQTGIIENLEDTGDIPPTEDNIIIEETEVENVAWNFRMFNNFKATEKLTFSAFLFYRGENKGLQFEVEPMYFVNLGARYSLWDGRGTFSVNYNDIFNSMEFSFEGSSPYPQVGAFNWESNTVYVGLSYRFGGGKYQAKSRKRRNNDEKSGGGGMF